MFRDTEDSSIPTRSDGLKVNFTTAPDMYHIPMGAAVVQPSLQMPLNDATLCLPPIAASIAVHERGTAAHGAAVRDKDLGYIIDPSLAAPTKIAYTVGGANIPPSIRFTEDEHLQPVAGPNQSGRTDLGALPAGESRMDNRRFDTLENLSSNAARLQKDLQAVSGSAYVGATPAILSGDDGARLRRVEELERSTAQNQQQLQQVSGRTDLGPVPAEFKVNAAKVEEERLLAAYAQRHQAEMGLVSGRTDLGALPITLEENEQRAREQRLLDYYSGVHKQELGAVSGRNESGPTPTVVDPERQHRLDMEERRKAGEAARQRDVNTVSNMSNLGAAVAPPSHMPDDQGIGPSEPDGRGASTTARASAWKSDYKARAEQAGYSFYDAAVHGASMGATVRQPADSTQDYMAEGLRTTDAREKLDAQKERVGAGAAAHSSALGIRGPDADVRTVSDHHLQPQGMNKHLGTLLPSQPPTAQEIQVGDFKQNVQTRQQKTNLGVAQPTAGQRLHNQEIQNLDSSVQPDRQVGLSNAPARKINLGANYQATEMDYAPLRNTKDDQLSKLDLMRSNFALPTNTRQRLAVTTKTVREVLLEQRDQVSNSLNSDMSKPGSMRCIRT
jgi:hypothetical protein